MISLNLKFYELLMLVGTIYSLKLFVDKILLPFLFKTRFMTDYLIKRELDKRKKVQEAQKELLNQRFQILKEFIEYVDKQLGSRHNRKAFWRDFALNESSRAYWMKRFEEEFSPKKK